MPFARPLSSLSLAAALLNFVGSSRPQLFYLFSTFATFIEKLCVHLITQKVRRYD